MPSERQTTYSMWSVVDREGALMLDHRGDDAEMTWNEFQDYCGQDGAELVRDGYRLVRVRAELVHDDEWPGQRVVQATRAMGRVRGCGLCGAEILGGAVACVRPGCPIQTEENARA